MAKFGLVGGKLGHSFSMRIHEKYYKSIGEESSFELIETSDVKKTLSDLEIKGYKGINVTIPHKKAVMEFLDEINPEAKEIGAVNTIKFEEGRLLGFNTDYYGFGAMLDKNGIKLENKKAYILGTGGAANAVFAYCKNNGANAVYVSRIPSDEAISYEELKNADEGILINCTPVGMYPNTEDTPTEYVEAFEAVVDLIYNPAKTKLLSIAENKGIKAVNGIYMLVAQAVYAEAIWHDRDFEKQIIDQIYKELSI